MVRLALRNYSVFLTECFVWKQNIFSRGGKNVFSAQSWFEYWSNKHFLVLGVFCFVVCFKRYVETCRKRNDASKTVKLLKRRFWEVLSKKALVGVSAGPKFDLGVRQNLNLLAKWEYEIVSKRVSELLFFFSNYAFVRTLENEQISSNVCFLVEFHWLGWNSTLLFFEVTKPS